MKYTDIYVIEYFEEAEDFRYEHNDKPVEIGTAVAYDKYQRGGARFGGEPGKPVKDEYILTCFEGIYFKP